MIRQSSDPWRLKALELEDRLTLIEGDLRDQSSLDRAIRETRPDEVYHLAAMSSVRESFGEPLVTGEVTALGSLRILEALRQHAPAARFYQASSSEMYGASAQAPQSELTAFSPSSPYAVAKVYAHQMTQAYREAYGLFACCGILFNHESPLRGPEFVTRKITQAAAAIAQGTQDRITLGNLEAQRDFGYAPEYVEAMWLMLQQDEPVDYVIATGEAHSIRDFAVEAFRVVGLDLDRYLDTDPDLLRPSDQSLVVGDPTRARTQLGWSAKTGFGELVRIMVDVDLARLDAQ